MGLGGGVGVSLTHLRLSTEVCCHKVGGEQADSLVRFPFPPVGVTRGQTAGMQSKTLVFILIHFLKRKLKVKMPSIFLDLQVKVTHRLYGLPVVQNSDDLSRLEGQLVVLRRLEVVDGSHFPAVRLVGGNQAGGVWVKARQRLLTLLFQRQLDGCNDIAERLLEPLFT